MSSILRRLSGSGSATSAAGQGGPSLILGVEDTGFPFKTESPFLFAVYHLDRYPRGNDKLGPDASLAGHSIGADFGNSAGWNMYHGSTVPGFPKHPHRGFETLTLTRKGWIDHTDSLGNAGRFGNGDAQWMTAGSGVNHSEMFPLLDRDQGNILELFQIWINLPRKSKMAKPSYKMFWAEEIPKAFPDGPGSSGTVEITLVHGVLPQLAAAPSPPPNSYACEAGSDMMVATVKLGPGSSWSLPAHVCAPGQTLVGLHRNLYFYAGVSVIVGGQTFTGSKKIKVRPDVDIEIVSSPAGPAEVLILQGREIGEPVVQHGPFVMSTKEEIRQAFADYQRTGFGGWPWPSDSEVHPRERQRFAQYGDGRVEEFPRT